MTQEFLSSQPDTNHSQVGRRSRMEIYHDVMKVIGEGAEKPTHIMYKANLSWTVTQICMKSLETQGLVLTSSEYEKRKYRLSQKGFQLLNEMQSAMNNLNIQNEP